MNKQTTDIQTLSLLLELKQLILKQTLLQKPVLNFLEACEYLQFSESYLYKLCSKKKIPHFKPNGKCLFFKRVELDEWLLRNRQKTESEISTIAANYAANNPFKF